MSNQNAKIKNTYQYYDWFADAFGDDYWKAFGKPIAIKRKNIKNDGDVKTLRSRLQPKETTDFDSCT